MNKLTHRILLFAFIGLFSFNLYAQDVSINLDFGVSNVSKPIIFNSSRETIGPGYTVATGLEFQLNSDLAIGLGTRALFSRYEKTLYSDNLPEISKNQQLNIRNNYYDFFVAPKYYLPNYNYENIKIFVGCQLGAYLAKVSGNLNWIEQSLNSESTIKKKNEFQKLKKWLPSFGVKTGIEFTVNQDDAIVLQLAWNSYNSRKLLNRLISNNIEQPLRFRIMTCFNISVGYRFCISSY